MSRSAYIISPENEENSQVLLDFPRKAVGAIVVPSGLQWFRCHEHPFRRATSALLAVFAGRTFHDVNRHVLGVLLLLDNAKRCRLQDKQASCGHRPSLPTSLGKYKHIFYDWNAIWEADTNECVSLVEKGWFEAACNTIQTTTFPTDKTDNYQVNANRNDQEAGKKRRMGACGTIREYPPPVPDSGDLMPSVQPMYMFQCSAIKINHIFRLG
ncbi:hypothetical protein VTI74DRAFT_10209 [Chaetomium olivicolor]